MSKAITKSEADIYIKGVLKPKIKKYQALKSKAKKDIKRIRAKIRRIRKRYKREETMDEEMAYKWAGQATRHTDGLVEPHIGQRELDSVASAILEAYKKGEAPNKCIADQENG